MKKTNDNRIPTAVVHRHWLTYESLRVSFIAANLHVHVDHCTGIQPLIKQLGILPVFLVFFGVCVRFL